MIPLQSLPLEHEHCDNREYCERNDLLNDFQLHEIERPSVFNETDSVCRNLGAVFEECHTPGEQDHQYQWP